MKTPHSEKKKQSKVKILIKRVPAQVMSKNTEHNKKHKGRKIQNDIIHPTIFSKPQLEPIRKGFGQGLLEAATHNQSIVGLCADLTESTYMHFFREQYPERFIQIGVAEQNLATVASGLAAMGKIPFITSYAMFSPGRNWEQIRTTIAYNDRPVIIAGSHAGISVGPDGGTHQALEDIALMSVIPNMVVLSPADMYEAKKATIAAAQLGVPVYIRLAREKTPLVTREDAPFIVGKGYEIFNSDPSSKKDVAICATGSVVYESIIAAKKLGEMGYGVAVYNIPTIKPLDTHLVLDAAFEYDALVTVEEHQIAGGLGSHIAQLIAQHRPVPIEFVGVKDRFGQSGTPEELLKHYSIDHTAIIHAAKKVLNRKL